MCVCARDRPISKRGRNCWNMRKREEEELRPEKSSLSKKPRSNTRTFS